MTTGTESTGTDDPMTKAIMDSFVAQVSVTFPGKVSEYDGELNGTTVTWTPELRRGDRDERARVGDRRRLRRAGQAAERADGHRRA